jgi:hypothetical protein
MPSLSTGIPNDGATQPSPCAATRAYEAGTSPPKRILGRPVGSAGLGPEAPETAPDHTCRMAASVASKVAPRVASGTSLTA